jgi:hypothetical protein
MALDLDEGLKVVGGDLQTENVLDAEVFHRIVWHQGNWIGSVAEPAAGKQPIPHSPLLAGAPFRRPGSVKHSDSGIAQPGNARSCQIMFKISKLPAWRKRVFTTVPSNKQCRIKFRQTAVSHAKVEALSAPFQKH